MKLALVSAALPPAIDGIGDYTAQLATELARTHAVTVFSGEADPVPIPGCAVRTVFDASRISSLGALRAAVAGADADWVVVQYCAFAFGRWGFNPYLPWVVRSLRSRQSGPRIAVTVHEPMAWPINWKLRTMNLWQGPQLRALARHSDLVFLVVDRWRNTYARWLGDVVTSHLPVGSNIPRLAVDAVAARRQLLIEEHAFVVGLFGQGHHSQQWDMAARAARNVQAELGTTHVLHLGSGSDRAKAEFAGLSVRSDGYLPADEVSRRLAAVDLFLAPFADGVSTRRTTLMAALQHGLPTVGTLGEASDPVLCHADGRALILTPSDDVAAYCSAVVRVARDANLRAGLRHEAATFYERHFSWPVIASRMSDQLAALAPHRRDGVE